MKMKIRKLLTLVITIGIIGALLAGCSTEIDQPQQSETPNNTEINSPLVMTDRAGNEIEIPEDIETIVSMGPSTTEVLVELGYADKIVATDTYSKDLGILAGDILYLDMMSPDIEQLIALDPDFVFATGMMMVEGTDPFKAVKDLGITVVYIPSSESIEEIYKDIIFTAQVLNEEEKGQEIVNNMKSEIESIQKIGDTISDKKTVYFEIAAAPNMVSFGKGAFQNEMIEIIGATNALGNLEGWVSISDEAVVAANPDVIITNVGYIDNPVEEIKSREGWENINAIKNDQVYHINDNLSSVPNHNIVIALKDMAKKTYPDKY
ncbi:MAG: ABC transporter substrate-binding protein [Tissierellia bacterium]|nr:ABC transporter substrate-binding protein [Tissierellia bacterium]MDD4725499.1 ABC transporter substrate-binding protein [Tissierellia bacterium]